MITIFKNKKDIPQGMKYVELNDIYFNQNTARKLDGRAQKVIEIIDEDKKSCRLHSTFTHIDVPFKYILARHNKNSFDSYCGWKNAEIILDARASDGKVLLDEAKEIYYASQIENNEDMKMEM